MNLNFYTHICTNNLAGCALVWFRGTSTIVDYLKPHPFYKCVLNMISKHILQITFLNGPDFMDFYFIRIILSTVNHSFTHSLMSSSIAT